MNYLAIKEDVAGEALDELMDSGLGFAMPGLDDFDGLDMRIEVSPLT